MNRKEPHRKNIVLRICNRSTGKILAVVSDRPVPAQAREIARYQEGWLHSGETLCFQTLKPTSMLLAPEERQKLFGETTKLIGSSYLTIQTKSQDGTWIYHVKNKMLYPNEGGQQFDFCEADLHHCITPTGRKRRLKLEVDRLWDFSTFLQDVPIQPLRPMGDMVEKKPILDMYGETGVFTGTLSLNSGKPHGKGRMDYNNNKGTPRWYDGEWTHGRWSGGGILRLHDDDTETYRLHHERPESFDIVKKKLSNKISATADSAPSNYNQMKVPESHREPKAAVDDTDVRIVPKGILKKTSLLSPDLEPVSAPSSESSILSILRHSKKPSKDHLHEAGDSLELKKKQDDRISKKGQSGGSIRKKKFKL